MSDAPEILYEDDQMLVTTRKSGNIEITSGLPEDFSPDDDFDAADENAWLSLMESGDATKRKSAMDMLKAIGHEPTKYIHWKKDERAMVLAAHARFGGDEEKKEKKEKKSSKDSAKGSSKGSSKDTAKGSSKSTKSAATSVDLSEITDRLDALEQEVKAQGAYIRETHMLMRVFVTANEEVSDFVDELSDDYYGNLQLPELAGNDEG